MALSPEQIEQIKKKFLEQIEQLPAEQGEYKEQLRQQISGATAEQLEAVLKQQQKGEECLFCSIAKGGVETYKVYEDNLALAFLDINPSAAGQVIVIPKEHYQFIFQIPDQVLWSLMKVVKMLEPLTVNVTQAKGLSIYISQGSAAGQRFPHLSINLIPRFEGDKAAFYWDRKEVQKEELEKAAKEIKESLDKVLREEKERIENIVKEKHKTQMKETEKKVDAKLEEFKRRRM